MSPIKRDWGSPLAWQQHSDSKFGSLLTTMAYSRSHTNDGVSKDHPDMLDSFGRENRAHAFLHARDLANQLLPSYRLYPVRVSLAFSFS
jgi:hypothetical protein